MEGLQVILRTVLIEVQEGTLTNYSDYKRETETENFIVSFS